VESVAVSTPYKLLGISVDADEEMIRAAFRTAAKRYHPDLNPDDPLAERRFRRLIRARDMLLDSERRSIHAGKNVLWHSRWRSPAKSTSGKIIGGVLVAISLFLIQRYSTLDASVTYASAGDIPDADSAEIKAMRDLQETWATQAPGGNTIGVMPKRTLHRGLTSSHRVLHRRFPQRGRKSVMRLF
jgi:hypothetical protein